MYVWLQYQWLLTCHINLGLFLFSIFLKRTPPFTPPLHYPPSSLVASIEILQRCILSLEVGDQDLRAIPLPLRLHERYLKAVDFMDCVIQLLLNRVLHSPYTI